MLRESPCRQRSSEVKFECRAESAVPWRANDISSEPSPRDRVLHLAKIMSPALCHLALDPTCIALRMINKND